MVQMPEKDANSIMDADPNEFAVQWQNRMETDSRRTLLVFNVGPHMVSIDDFQSTFDAVLNTVEDLNFRRQQNDIFTFRTNVPGHWGCEHPDSESPHPSYGHYATKSSLYVNETAKFRWEMYEHFNDFVLQRLRGQPDEVPIGRKGAQIELLDVHPMTVLRQDGHCALDTNNSDGIADCLHYSLPGPIDWWNHLLFSNLRERELAGRVASMGSSVDVGTTIDAEATEQSMWG